MEKNIISILINIKLCQCIKNTLTFFISLVKSEIVVFIKKFYKNINIISVKYELYDISRCFSFSIFSVFFGYLSK